MNKDDQNQIEQAARNGLDQNLDELPEDITSALATARANALRTAEAALSESKALSGTAALSEKTASSGKTARIYRFDRPKVIWSGAIAASVTALALTLSLQQPGTELHPDADYLLTLAELESLDETEWALVQDLEFALWLSYEGLSTQGLSSEGLIELEDEAFTIEPQS